MAGFAASRMAIKVLSGPVFERAHVFMVPRSPTRHFNGRPSAFSSRKERVFIYVSVIHAAVSLQIRRLRRKLIITYLWAVSFILPVILHRGSNCSMKRPSSMLGLCLDPACREFSWAVHQKEWVDLLCSLFHIIFALQGRP